MNFNYIPLIAAEQGIGYMMPEPACNTVKEIKWNGRCMYYITGAMVLTGAVGSAMAAFSFFAPMVQVTVPSWVLGAFGGAIAVVTCCGGCCLWKNIPRKTFEDLVFSLENTFVQNKKKKKVLNDKVDEVTNKNNSLVVQLENLNDKSGNLTEHLSTTSTDLKSTLNEAEMIKRSLEGTSEQCVILINEIFRVENEAREPIQERKNETDELVRLSDFKNV